MLPFNDFVHKSKLKNKPTSKKKNYQAPPSIGLDIVVIYLKGGPFSSDVGMVNLHPSKGTHWVAYRKENFLIVMVVLLHINYLNFLKNEMDSVYILNIKYKD